MPITGHTTLAEVPRYTAAAEQTILAQAAIARLLPPASALETADKSTKRPEKR
ncbi:hypothetical protein [Plastoroseomonas hellenica]|uniref:hypothetical protein n=1 Tax=Plastoroseomonas hellenica TaxID=2687306 RepID=UPI001BAA85AF|nr:hypothetical protein [Plastoroseomonas hellenica]MBR0643400.1 integrase [Plastoroseomonas hellenica]